MDNSENMSQSSSLPQPASRIPGLGKSLADITTATNNTASSFQSKMMPPGAITQKFKEANTPAPPRETLMSRAGKPSRSVAAPPSIRPVNNAVKTTSISGPRHGSSASMSSSSTVSRTPSTISRHNSTSSYSTSTSGTRARPPSQQAYTRPKTSMGTRTTGRPGPRAATAFGYRDHHDDDDVVPAKRKGTFDVDARDEHMTQMFEHLKALAQENIKGGEQWKELADYYKKRVSELEDAIRQLNEANSGYKTEVEITKFKLEAVENQIVDVKRDAEIEVDGLRTLARVEAESVRQEERHEAERLMERAREEFRRQRDIEREEQRKILDAEREEQRKALEKQRDEYRDLQHRFEIEVENERKIRMQEMSQASAQNEAERLREKAELDNKTRELERTQAELQKALADLERERALGKTLQQNLTEAAANTVTLESSLRALKSKVEFLESDGKAQSAAFTELDQRLADALAETEETKGKLRAEETLRRKLHNQVQELKGNIRVFCRVRPAIGEDNVAKIAFPDTEAESKEIEVQGPAEKSAMGNVTTKMNAFSFDRVFGPQSQNAEVFEEISQLVQSALDGYNVCIFCYGQTGSGKTHTMSSADGMIPRAVHQIYDTAKALEEKGWTYSMQGSFLEVYNENLNDLLGKSDDLDKKKHEIRHDLANHKTIITDIETVELDTPSRVEEILKQAATNRSVAATKANERSSRSHSVFILKLIGTNSMTGERSEGVLNLVDLAGSERLAHSQATGERLRETQNINRSLACLGDVIAALGMGKEGGHVPYRNSKLTYLLQFSLGGNSKTLMFVNVSPANEHLAETLTSLKFATKVHNTHIGTARKSVKVK